MRLFKKVYMSWVSVFALGWILWHLVLIYRHREGVVIMEKNKNILKLEIVVTSALVLLALEQVGKVVKEGER